MLSVEQAARFILLSFGGSVGQRHAVTLPFVALNLCGALICMFVLGLLTVKMCLFCN